MGVVNVTPDSFSDGGRYLSLDAAVSQALRLEEAGASIIDVGGESTRPGAVRVEEHEELKRIVPVVRALRARSAVPISVDTTRVSVAAAALDEGADIINDISGFRFEPDLAGVVGEHRAGCVLMHTPARPREMMNHATYADVTASVRASLEGSMRIAREAGVEELQIVLDPGFGFGKQTADNWRLLSAFRELRRPGRPLLVGVSRKRMLRDALSTAGADVTEDALDVATATACAFARMAGASIFRVHDVRSVRAALAVVDALRQHAAPDSGSGEGERVPST
ncbi:MAG: dihydropteroate synthase [Deltaproteobacteria bacterium]|nr:MAG: dihydropteroate synthase [Deltaproteobacteria bacterium]